MTRIPLYCVPLLLLVITLDTSPALANWPLNGAPVSLGSNNENELHAASDGAGGALVTWGDIRSGSNYDIYVQRIDGWGRTTWTQFGVAACVATGDQNIPKVADDGTGGAIVTWMDSRGADSDIYVQRIDASGTVLWTANGVAVCTATGNQSEPQVVGDGAGGAVVTWSDLRGGTSDIYAQRLNKFGAPQWTANGFAVCVATGNQTEPRLAHTGFGGGFFTWTDGRGANLDIYAMWLDQYAVPYWTLNGSPVCTATGNQQHPELISDGSGGIVVTWEDLRGVSAAYAQRLDTNGAPVWTANGVDLCSNAAAEYEPRIASDGSGGAIVTWSDARTANADIYVQRIDVLGALLWNAAGVALCSAPNYQQEQHIVGDGIGGAIVSWLDTRTSQYADVYARRVDAAGVAQGPSNGVPLSVLSGSDQNPRIASDGAGGAIVAWLDARGFGGFNIYAQRLDRFDQWGYPSPDIAGVDDIPGDQGGQINLSWDASRLDPWPNQSIGEYTVWRAIDPALAALFAGSGTPVIELGESFDATSTEAIRIETLAGQTYYWQLMSTVDAYYINNYAQTVPTLFDSTATSPDNHYFQVIAHGFGEFWVSAPASGKSIDNLAPAAPLLLTAQLTGPDVLLNWNPSGANEADFGEYAVYRATSSGVQPIPNLFLSSVDDTVLVDNNVPGGVLYYIVTARDVHGNQSNPSNEASVAISTAIGDHAPRLTQLTLEANYPNPFSHSTELRVGLPRASDVRLEVYDVAGRRVVARTVAQLGAGWQRVTFDGRDARGTPLPSGVYFGRVTAGGESQTMKMVIRR